MNFVKSKKERIDTCNLCLARKPLTWDHVPPRSGLVVRHLEVEPVFQAMTSRDPNRRLKEQQDGIKFRTLCETCNNDAIGRYDPALGRFTTEVAAILKSPLHLPPVIHLEMNPTAVARAILGHLVAANLRGDRPLDQAVRPLFAVNGQCLADSDCTDRLKW